MFSQTLVSKIGKGTPLTKRASAHLDMIRGIAALAVLAGHVRGLFFVDYHDVASKSPLMAGLYAVTGLGHEAVMVFFVLSGFLIGGSVLTSLKRWDWKRYLVNRFCRLYLVLLPALLVTAAFDYIAQRQPAGRVYFEQPIAHFNTEPLAGRNTLKVFAGNALFLQTLVVPAYGSNSPLWSLAYEFWYYIWFPALMVSAFAAQSTAKRVCGFAVALLLLIWLPDRVIGGFVIWMMGTAVHLLPARHAGRAARWGLHLVTSGIFATMLMISRAQIVGTRINYAIGFSFAMWLYCLVKLKTPRPEVAPAYGWLAKLFSKCSYSLYAVHFPLVLLIRAASGTFLWTPTIRNLALGMTLGFAVFLFGLLFSRLTEAHNDKVRGYILRFIAPSVAVSRTAA